MPRGRKPIEKSSTKFKNAKGRVIFMTANGKYVAKSAKGSTVYNPKAKFVVSPGGTNRVLTNSQARVPTAIRPKMMRAKRVNAGKARGPRAYKAGVLQTYARAIGPKRPAGRPRKHLVSPMAALGLGALFKSPMMGPGPVQRHHMRRVAAKQRAAHKRLMKKLAA
jgi:hypothetical protein